MFTATSKQLKSPWHACDNWLLFVIKPADQSYCTIETGRGGWGEWWGCDRGGGNWGNTRRSAAQLSTIQYNTIQHKTAQHHTTPHHTTPHHTTQPHHTTFHEYLGKDLLENERLGTEVLLLAKEFKKLLKKERLKGRDSSPKMLCFLFVAIKSHINYLIIKLTIALRRVFGFLWKYLANLNWTVRSCIERGIKVNLLTGRIKLNYSRKVHEHQQCDFWGCTAMFGSILDGIFQSLI